MRTTLTIRIRVKNVREWVMNINSPIILGKYFYSINGNNL